MYLKKITLAAGWRVGGRETKGEAVRRHLQSGERQCWMGWRAEREGRGKEWTDSGSMLKVKGQANWIY